MWGKGAAPWAWVGWKGGAATCTNSLSAPSLSATYPGSPSPCRAPAAYWGCGQHTTGHIWARISLPVGCGQSPSQRSAPAASQKPNTYVKRLAHTCDERACDFHCRQCSVSCRGGGRSSMPRAGASPACKVQTGRGLGTRATECAPRPGGPARGSKRQCTSRCQPGRLGLAAGWQREGPISRNRFVAKGPGPRP